MFKCYRCGKDCDDKEKHETGHRKAGTVTICGNCNADLLFAMMDSD